MKKIPDALWRVLTVFAVVIAGALFIRSMLPPAMTDHSAHIASTIARESARPIRHAGSEVCAGCHEESERKKSGYHKNLSCETCHGPAKEHSENPTEIKPNLPRLREFCVTCHAYNSAKPTGFPQIIPAAHNPLKACIACHNPHDPKPPQVPHECSACHAQIARTKALSPHVQLECTTCHAVPSDHRVAPRTVRASIPAERAFCGKCHAKNSSNKETPKVDMATHGEKYLCWQCHYPHMPEVE